MTTFRPVTLAAALLVASAADPQPATGLLQVSAANPRYFTDDTGRAVYLTGSHIGWELQDHAWGRDLAFDYDAFLEFLSRHGHNCFRMWMVEHTGWAKDDTPPATPMPWARTGPGTAHDGGLKFDLEQFDPGYFGRLRQRAIAAGDRGIYCAVMLFQGWSIESKGRTDNPWATHPFNRRNNVNGVDGDLNGDGEGTEVHTLQSPRSTALQEAYVRHVVDTVNDLDNVLYEIANESGAYSTEWQYHMIRFVKAYEATKPKQHPVGMTAQYAGGGNDALFDGPADWVSPNSRAPGGHNYRDNPPPADGRKVVLIDTDHLWGVNGPAQGDWAWKCFCRGLNPIYMDSYTNQEELTVITEQEWDPPREPIRRAMGHTRRYAERMDLVKMAPRGDLASSGYCLASPGQEYLVYVPAGGRVSVDLSDAEGRLSVEWFDVRRGEAKPAGTVNGGAGREFVAAFVGPAVLYLDGAP